MAKLHTKTKGRSGSRKVKGSTKWADLSPEEVENLIVDLRKAGNTAARIGVVLRDQYGILSVQELCKKSITYIIEEKSGKIQYPDDLLNLIKKAVNLRKHMAENKGDTHNKTGLNRIESKIRRLAVYYTKKKRLPTGWRYSPETAALIVR